MIIWNENLDEVRKVTPDKEMAKSLLEMINLRFEYLEKVDSEKFTTLLVEGYYEIIKEAITALMNIYGYKTTSHEILIGFLAHFYKDKFSSTEIYFLDRLRKLRNDIEYRGVFIKKDFWERNSTIIFKIIEKLKRILENKLG